MSYFVLYLLTSFYFFLVKLSGECILYLVLCVLTCSYGLEPLVLDQEVRSYRLLTVLRI